MCLLILVLYLLLESLRRNLILVLYLLGRNLILILYLLRQTLIFGIVGSLTIHRWHMPALHRRQVPTRRLILLLLIIHMVLLWRHRRLSWIGWILILGHLRVSVAPAEVVIIGGHDSSVDLTPIHLTYHCIFIFPDKPGRRALKRDALFPGSGRTTQAVLLEIWICQASGYGQPRQSDRLQSILPDLL